MSRSSDNNESKNRLRVPQVADHPPVKIVVDDVSTDEEDYREYYEDLVLGNKNHKEVSLENKKQPLFNDFRFDL